MQESGFCGFFLLVKLFLFPCSPWTALGSAWYFPWLPVLGYGINTTLPAHREVTVGGNANHTLSKLLPGPLQEVSETQRHMGDQITGSKQEKSWLDFPGAVSGDPPSPTGH